MDTSGQILNFGHSVPFWILETVFHFEFWTLAVDFGFWSVVANLSFWTVMADLGFCALVADFGFRHWWPILDFGH